MFWNLPGNRRGAEYVEVRRELSDRHCDTQRSNLGLSSSMKTRPRLKWTDRKFDFSFPAGLYPEMIERLRGVPPRLEDHFRNLGPQALTARHDDRWSIQENAGHLLDLESLVQQRVEEYVKGADVLHAADMSNHRALQ